MSTEQLTNAANTPDISTVIEARKNFARSAETMASSGTPGFEAYVNNASGTAHSATSSKPVSGTDDVHLVSFRGEPQGPQMSYQDNDFSFGDVLDILNPLQHIPLVNLIYRNLTGDDNIKPYAQVAGDIAYGGAVGGSAFGAIFSSSNEAEKESLGKTTEAPRMLAEGKTPADVSKAYATASANANGKVTAAPLSQNNAMLAGLGASKNVTGAQMTSAAKASQIQGAASATRQPFGGAIDLNSSQSAAMINNNTVGGNANANAASSGAPDIASSKMLRTNLSSKLNAARAQALYAPPVANASSASAQQGAATESNAAKAEVVVTTPTTNAANAMPSAKADQAVVANGTAPNLLASTAAPSETSVTKGMSDSAQLGALMHSSAEQVISAQNNGGAHPLPPELVQDMMMMALEKYKKTGELAQAPVTVQ